MAESLDADSVYGAVSLLCRGNGSYELSKMGVRPAAQGKGIGRALVERAIEAFQDSEGTELFLETHSLLVPAIALYESLGFVDQGHSRPGSKYQRSDVYMIWRRSAQSDV